MSDIIVFGHDHFMRKALQEAEKALASGEVPVGAVVVHSNKIIGKGHNQTELLKDPTAHAEMIAITAATQALGGKYLKGCTLYVTLEPCVMCGGALGWSQVDKVVYGASDEKKGYAQLSTNILHPKTSVLNGVLQEECKGILDEFFATIRKS